MDQVPTCDAIDLSRIEFSSLQIDARGQRQVAVRLRGEDGPRRLLLRTPPLYVTHQEEAHLKSSVPPNKKKALTTAIMVDFSTRPTKSMDSLVDRALSPTPSLLAKASTLGALRPPTAHLKTTSSLPTLDSSGMHATHNVDMDRFISCLASLDTALGRMARQRHARWFGLGAPGASMDEVKPTQVTLISPGSPMTGRLAVRVPFNFKEGGNELFDARYECIIELTGVWFQDDSFGYAWSLHQSQQVEAWSRQQQHHDGSLPQPLLDSPVTSSAATSNEMDDSVSSMLGLNLHDDNDDDVMDGKKRGIELTFHEYHLDKKIFDDDDGDFETASQHDEQAVNALIEASLALPRVPFLDDSKHESLPRDSQDAPLNGMDHADVPVVGSPDIISDADSAMNGMLGRGGGGEELSAAPSPRYDRTSNNSNSSRRRRAARATRPSSSSEDRSKSGSLPASMFHSRDTMDSNRRSATENQGNDASDTTHMVKTAIEYMQVVSKMIQRHHPLRLLQMAIQYQVVGLQAECLQSLERSMRVDDLWEAASLGKSMPCAELTKVCVDYLCRPGMMLETLRNPHFRTEAGQSIAVIDAMCAALTRIEGKKAAT